MSTALLTRGAEAQRGSASLVLKDAEFKLFQQWIHSVAGITMGATKKALVAGRLARRLQERGQASYDAYFQLLQRDPDEHQRALDLLTTNETHFFREPRHFEVLRDVILPERVHDGGGQPLRIWSAACSTGQEPYSLAMWLAHHVGDTSWEIFASDICSRVLERARTALYDMALAREIPDTLLKAWCFKGVGSQSGRFLIAPEIARKVRFAHINLNEDLPDTGALFDVIFLRNVMIYFNESTKKAVVNRLVQRLRPGGWLVVGHSESLHGICDGVQSISPSVYRRSL